LLVVAEQAGRQRPRRLGRGHASDAANGWRHIAKVAGARNTFASLTATGYHTAGQAGWQISKPYPLVEDVAKVESKDGEKLTSSTR
jgi:hypothetical protein